MSVGVAYVLFLLAFGLIGTAACLGGSVLSSHVKDWREVNRDYDRLVNTLIDGDMFELERAHTIRAGSLRVWISNYPYSYGHPYDCGVSEHLRISTKTKRRLKEYVERKSVLRALERVKETA